MPSTVCRCGAKIEYRRLKADRVVPAQRVRGAYFVPRAGAMELGGATNWIESGAGGWVWIDHRDVCPTKGDRS